MPRFEGSSQRKLVELKRVVDRCHICGKVCPLSFEHIPPQKAFNNTGVLIADMAFDGPLMIGGAPPGAKTFQKGMGSYSLCPQCNNDTGAWYGEKFVQFCKKGMILLEKTGHKPSLCYFGDIYPLAIIKQIVSMFLSINSLAFRDKYVDLVGFVLDPRARNLHPRYAIYIYFNHEGMHRATPISVKLDLKTSTMEHLGTRLMTEISYPPFGYLMTVDSQPPNAEVVDITFFSSCAYEQQRTLSMQYPVYLTHTFFPGDYRSIAEIARDNREKGGIVP
jgi:hypothetical protein